ncbi:hypothetical protein PY093_17455 [Cytobacillus sp. S13-E01]|uniref:hypothetical protein n=1 Tax=Cytobacillus sp. S13-E01 TaxID=3031326 RepID=UPI0023D8B9B5|nr:hypothetical protein [Cytobacillus sp. S13-E01]MDF0728427.1 hypothetical protein [Cytobacillus sp. S13-E01]
MNSPQTQLAFHFDSKRLREVADKIEEKYAKYNEEYLTHLAVKRLPRLLENIRNLSLNQNEILAFAKGLKNIDIRILTYEFPYHREEETTQLKIVKILEHRYERFIGRRLWDHFHVYPKDPHIFQLLKTTFKIENDSFLSLDSRIRSQYEEAFGKEKYLQEIAKKIGYEQKKVEESFKEWRIQANTKLETLLWTYILMFHIGRKEFITREGPAQII